MLFFPIFGVLGTGLRKRDLRSILVHLITAVMLDMKFYCVTGVVWFVARGLCSYLDFVFSFFGTLHPWGKVNDSGQDLLVKFVCTRECGICRVLAGGAGCPSSWSVAGPRGS